MLLWPIAALTGFIVIFTKWGLTAAFSFWCACILVMVTLAFQLGGRARREIRIEIERTGYTVVKMKYRYLRLGLFSLWNSSRTQYVYRVLVRDTTGREHIVWAQWGRRWYWDQDTLELRWEGEASPR